MTPARTYLAKAKALLAKLEIERPDFPQNDIVDAAILIELDEFMKLLQKQYCPARKASYQRRKNFT